MTSLHPVGLIDTSILPAAEYNDIPDIEEHRSSLLNRVQPDVLQILGNIFVKYNVDPYFGIHLLHRHFPIPDRTIMLHRFENPDVEICQVTSVDDLAGLKLRGR